MPEKMKLAIIIALAVSQAGAALAATSIINIYTSPAGAQPAGVTRSANPRTPAATPAIGYPPTPTTAPVATPVTAPGADGLGLYNQYCSSCHGQSMLGKSASSTQSAINSNKGGMGSLKSLSSAQLQAIATASASGSSAKKARSGGGD